MNAFLYSRHKGWGPRRVRSYIHIHILRITRLKKMDRYLQLRNPSKDWFSFSPVLVEKVDILMLTIPSIDNSQSSRTLLTALGEETTTSYPGSISKEHLNICMDFDKNGHALYHFLYLPSSLTPSRNRSLISVTLCWSSSCFIFSFSSNARYFLRLFFVLLAFRFRFRAVLIAVRLSFPFSTMSTFSARISRAIFRFWDWERVAWHLTTMPVGWWISWTAELVLF